LYFNPLLDPLRNAQTIFLKLKKQNYFNAILNYHKKLQKYDLKYCKEITQTSKVENILKNDTLRFKYGKEIL
jgi:hypothetical protein